MSKLQELKDKLSEILVKDDPYKDGSSLVPKPDYDSIERKINPVERGQERGKQNQPPLGTTDPDEVELEIKSIFQEMVDKTSEDVRTTVATYDNRLLGFDFKGILDEARDVCRSSISDFEAEIIKAKEDVSNAKQKVIDKVSDLKYFQDENGLRRSASYPSDDMKYLKLGLVALLFFLETIGNAVFLAKGNEFGVTGAYTEAFVISILNLGVGFLLGLFVSRQIFGNNHLLKFLSLLFIIAMFFLSGVWNLLIAHYREVSSSGLLGEAGNLAIQAMKEDAWGLQSVQSWSLFLVGWLFWLVALLDAHWLDDSFPGYGTISRAAHDAKEFFARSKVMVIEHLGDLKEYRERQIKELRGELGDIQLRISYLISQKSQTIEDYDIFCHSADIQFQRIINSYRDANKAERSRSPGSFRKKLALNFPKIKDKKNVISLDEVESVISVGREELDRYIEQFYQKFNEAVNALETLDELRAESMQKYAAEGTA